MVLGCGSATPIDAIVDDSTDAANSTNSTISANSTDSTSFTHPIDSADSSRRAAVVAMGKLCRCYDDNRVMCYAICGAFEAEISLVKRSPLLAAYVMSEASRICSVSQLEATVLCLVALVLISKTY